ncbi:transposase [Lactiplantibacillus pentosus]|uniref:transposase n=4 Tax=Lactiplantibacillus TaxID=2767842 RepID=UPI003C7221CD
MKNYPSNITRKQFEQIRPELESFRKQTRPRKYDLYEVFCAIIYVLKTGCQWRQVPSDFPEWHSVYNYYKLWSASPFVTEASLLDNCLKKLSLNSVIYNHAQPKRHLSSQLKVRSTNQRCGSTSNLCSSLRLATCTVAFKLD